ncbi:hypothetical protein, partial [Rhizobium halophytocola]|uniref:hypothetical protein n=1 Tax=Rhizobium halophytocola TaxID=735519 RepID=UPI001AE5D9AB
YLGRAPALRGVFVIFYIELLGSMSCIWSCSTRFARGIFANRTEWFDVVYLPHEKCHAIPMA